MEHDIIDYYNQNKSRFHSNHRPTAQQAAEIFEMANRIDPRGGHRQSSCGRCYRNALRAIVDYVRKVTK